MAAQHAVDRITDAGRYQYLAPRNMDTGHLDFPYRWSAH